MHPPLIHLRLLSLLAIVIATAGCGMFRSDKALLSQYPKSQIEQSNSQNSQVAYEELIPKEEKKSFSQKYLSPPKFTDVYKQLTGSTTNPENAKKLYQQAEAEFTKASQTKGAQRKSAFYDTAKIYKRAAQRWPDSALEQDSMFMVGECYFFADYYPKANLSYEELLKKYPNSRHLDVVEARRFLMARYWLDVNRVSPQSFYSINLFDKKIPSRGAFGKATKIFDKIHIEDPTGRLADDAIMAAANAHFEAGDYLTADEFYTDLRSAFPSSEHQFKAHLLGVKAKLETYRGPEDDSAALDQSDLLLKQIRKQFRHQARDHEKYLNRAEREVRYLKAQREWKYAKYYDRRGEYGGARFYYQSIVRDFSDTPFAQRANERIEQISDRPAVPPQRLSWLVDLFPETVEAKPLFGADKKIRR